MSKKAFTFDYGTVEQAVANADKGALMAWVDAAAAYETAAALFSESNDGKVLSVVAFADGWQKQFPTRSANTVRQNVGTVRWAIANGYDMKSFVSLDHLNEVKAGKVGGKHGNAEKKAEKVVVTVKKGATVKDIDKAIKALEAKKAALLGK